MAINLDEDVSAGVFNQLRRTVYFGFVVMFTVFLLIILIPRIFIPIKSGQMGIIYRFLSGTDMINSYGEGLHIIWPWNSMFVYDVRLQIVQKEYTLLTKGGMPVEVKVAIRYRPDMRVLSSLHVNVGPDYLNKIVFPEVEQVLRREVGRLDSEEVYTSAKGFLESIVVSSLKSAEARYVLIDDILVKSVTLPASLNEAIGKKLALKEELKGYEYRLMIERKEAERKLIEARGIQEYQKTVSQTLSPDILRWQGILATRELATSSNAKTVVIGSGKEGLPLILNER